MKKIGILVKSFLIDDENNDKEYAQFSCKCFHLQQLIGKNMGLQLSPGQLDNLLLEVSKK
jgi:hypothetical protein